MTVHEYDYDLLGRQIEDRVTAVGPGVDNAILRIASTYEVRGMRTQLTSYDNASVGSGGVVNGILFIYNDFGQLVSDYQSHGGAVDTSTTPRVQYSYANGSGNTIRPTSLTYPDGRVITYQYGLTNSSSDALSRIDTLSDSLGSSDLQTYQYLGIGSFVSSDSLGAEVRWQLYSPDGSFDPDTGDIYTGLDRFGRVKDNRWYGYGALVPQDVDRYRYGYDRNGNRIWKENLIAGISSLPFDEQYGYDHLDRLQQMDRGLFDENHKLQDQSFAQNWSLDATGNWRKFVENDYVSPPMEQVRKSNKVNEITQIGSGWATPRYDRAGNMTRIPLPISPGSNVSATYDAWNRLVKIEQGGGFVVTYQYDGAKRRIVESRRISLVEDTRHLYYTEPSRWQVIEEHFSDGGMQQYVWGQRYIDELVLRDFRFSGGTPERLWVLQDANWNVTALITNGVVHQRYTYLPYGESRAYDGGWSPESDPILFEYQFAGYRFETTTGLYHVRNRVYHDRLGCWVQRDPLGYVSGMSLHEYVASQPANNNDPSGLLIPPGANPPTLIIVIGIIVIIVIIILPIVRRSPTPRPPSPPGVIDINQGCRPRRRRDPQPQPRGDGHNPDEVRRNGGCLWDDCTDGWDCGESGTRRCGWQRSPYGMQCGCFAGP